MAVYALHWR